MSSRKMVIQKILAIINAIKAIPEIMKNLPSALTILKKIGAILKGWYYKIFNKNEELANQRITICHQCEQRTHIDVVGDICAHCGCVISAKARVKDEYCELNKW